MEFPIGLKIFILSMIALIAELIMYYLFTINAVVSMVGDVIKAGADSTAVVAIIKVNETIASSSSVIFMVIIIMTILTGVFSLILAFLQALNTQMKKDK